MTLPFDPYLLIFLGGILGGIVSGLAGFGAGPVVLAVWLAKLAPQEAAPLLAVSILPTALLNLRVVWHAIDGRRLAPWIVGGAIGIPIGVYLLAYIAPSTFKMVVGGLLVAYSLARLTALRSLTLRFKSPLPDVGAGAVAGLMSGLASIPGPLASLWCGLRGWGKDEQRAVFSPFNILCSMFTIASLAVAGLVTPDTLRYALAAVPGLLLGNQIGTPYYRRLSDGQFQNVILVLLALMGLAMML